MSLARVELYGLFAFKGVMMAKKNSSGKIPDEVLKFVADELQKISNGEIIFIAQDGYLIQVEIHQRRRISDWQEENLPREDKSFSVLEKNIRQEFSKLDYGQLSIRIQKGRIIQIERVVRQRFTGLDGEGI